MYFPSVQKHNMPWNYCLLNLKSDLLHKEVTSIAFTPHVVLLPYELRTAKCPECGCGAACLPQAAPVPLLLSLGVTGSMLPLFLGCTDLAVGSEHTLPETVTHTLQLGVQGVTGSHLPSGSVCHETPSEGS